MALGFRQGEHAGLRHALLDRVADVGATNI